MIFEVKAVKKQRTYPKFGLLLFCLVCVLASMLVAWFGITRRSRMAENYPGFPASAERSESFVVEGQLVHIMTRDLSHGPTGVDARFTVRIELNHDRVLSDSIQHCLDKPMAYGYFLSDVVHRGDSTNLANYVRHKIDSVNGTGTMRSFTVEKVEPIAR